MTTASGKTMTTSCVFVATLAYLALVTSAAAEDDGLKLAAFNVQTFGVSTMIKRNVPEILANILVRYDLILIEEVRDSSGAAIEELLELVNCQICGEHKVVVSGLLGRSSYKEQYAFFYKSDVIQVVDSYQYSDTSTTFERAPFVVKFNSSATGEFAVIPIRTEPENAVEEIDALADVYEDMLQRWSPMRDVIIAGDFNAATPYVSESDWNSIRLWTDPTYTWLIGSNDDTTVSVGTVQAYDRFVVAGDNMASRVSGGGVFLFDQQYNLAKVDAMGVSDRYPIEMMLYSGCDGVSCISHTILLVLLTLVFIGF